jgi:hypothetical protein
MMDDGMKGNRVAVMVVGIVVAGSKIFCLNRNLES